MKYTLLGEWFCFPTPHFSIRTFPLTRSHKKAPNPNFVQFYSWRHLGLWKLTYFPTFWYRSRRLLGGVHGNPLWPMDYMTCAYTYVLPVHEGRRAYVHNSLLFVFFVMHHHWRRAIIGLKYIWWKNDELLSWLIEEYIDISLEKATSDLSIYFHWT